MSPSVLLEDFKRRDSSSESSEASKAVSQSTSPVIAVPEPLAIVGFSLRFPQEATTPEAFWSMLLEKRCAMTEWPNDRMNSRAHYHSDKSRNDAFNVKGGHFLSEDLGAFDAPFFSIVAAEAECMDPQHRIMLETTYRALENVSPAGISLEKAASTHTGVYTGAFADDFKLMTLRDTEVLPKHATTGSALSLLANRTSWFFNLKGPSINVDTACSSSMVALDLACQGLRNGDSQMAIVAGSNLVFGLENILTMSNMNFFSPDGKCFSFDHRANGYARGEGLGALIVKRLSSAIEDGDTIRAVIRSTGSNQDGRTPGITQPSGDAQATLIKHTYEKAGLDMKFTRFFEAHGTGTAIGDPIEAAAIGDVFRKHRSPDDPLYIGAVKSNIGHLEGSSGIAGVIKAILVLEKGIIPPNANFKQLNPRIDADLMNLRFPTMAIPWPTDGLRRASVNSFGFGGANAHVVLDDACNYLRLNGLNGKHHSVPEPPRQTVGATSTVHHQNSDREHRHMENYRDKIEKEIIRKISRSSSGSVKITTKDTEAIASMPRLLVWSAGDENGLQRLSGLYNAYLRELSHVPDSLMVESRFLDNLAYTLANRRTALAWKAFMVVNNVSDLTNQPLSMSRPIRSSSKLGVAYLFTGQGAQYAEMGRELLNYDVFRATLLSAEKNFWALGCGWSLIDELLKPEGKSRIQEPVISQSLSTALQIALVQLLRSFGIAPSAVVGHSSGEIAAAYCVGAISLAAACRLAYIRGKLASSLTEDSRSTYRGAMLSVGFSENSATQYMEKLKPMSIRATVACVNSSNNVTLSGDEASIDFLKVKLDADGIFARKLMVNVAYHSPQMNEIAVEYLEAIQHLQEGEQPANSPIMVSSVTGDRVTPADLRKSEYWVRNMVSTVRFSEAVSKLTLRPVASGKKLGVIRQKSIAVHQLLEIGPHCALRAPVRTILNEAERGKNISYDALLTRSRSALQTTLEAMGRLYCLGYSVSFQDLNHPDRDMRELQSLADLPEYPFDHSERYWYESRISRGFSHRKHPRSDLLGTAVDDWNPLEARWRKIIRISEAPWVADHKVNGAIIYPAAAMFVMAIEAAKQMVHPNRKIKGYLIEDATFHHAVNVSANGGNLELQFYMRAANDASDKSSSRSQYRVCMYDNAQWIENCRGTITVEYEESDLEGRIAYSKETDLSQSYHKQLWEEKQCNCTQTITEDKVYQHYETIGMGYGPHFRALQDIKFNESGEATAEVRTYDWSSQGEDAHVQDHVIHPVTLDAAAQLIFLALTNGAKTTIPTTIPTRVRNLWVASSGLSYPSATSIKAYTKSAFKGHRTTESSLFALDAATGELKLVITSLETTTVSNHSPENVEAPTQLCNELILKPDIELLSSKQTATYCKPSDEDTVEPVQFYQDLSFLIFAFISKTLDELPAQQPNDAPDHLKKYVAWMRMQRGKYHVGELAHSEAQWQILAKDQKYVQDITERVAASGAEGRLFVEVGQQLQAIVQGETDPLDFLFNGDLAKDYYQHIFNPSLSLKMAAYIDLLSHKNPSMKIIEVGAGTGSITREVLAALKVPGSDDGIARYAQYDYTDISGAYFEKAGANLGGLVSRMRFKVLDIEFDPAEQGLEAHSYDLVVAGLVLHATRNLKTTLRNVRKLLRPGGKLLMFEIVVPEVLRTGFVFGLLPGWWLGTEETREWGPSVAEPEWHHALATTGFSGVDLTFPDHDGPSCHEMSLMVSTATPEAEPTQELPSDLQLAIIIDPSSSAQVRLGLDIKCRMESKEVRCAVISLREAALVKEPPSEYFVVYLLEVEDSFLYDIDKDSYDLLHKSLVNLRHMLWVTSGGGDGPLDPRHAMFDGVARVLRSEDTQLKCVTLALDARPSAENKSAEARNAKHITNILHTLIFRELEDLEPEYVEKDGLLNIHRLNPNTRLNQVTTRFDKPVRNQLAFGHGPPLAMAVANPGMLDSLLFVDDEDHARPLAPQEIEIQVKAAGVNFMDCLTVLGRVNKRTVGGECAGVVTRVGSACEQHFQPGDRVCAAILDCFRTFARSSSMLVTKIPNHLSFQAASSIPVTGVTTHYALVEFARLQEGESVLIHSAAGGVGQLAIQMGQRIGAIIYVTVGTDEKKRFLMEKYNIPEDHILSSRNTSFAQGIMRLTCNRGADVVLNSLSGELLTASWDCIASFGRFVEIGKKDIHSHASLPMFPFRKNVSFGAVDLDHMHIEKPTAFRKSLVAVVRMLTEHKLQVASPLHVYPVSDIESALRFMQSGKHIGKIVIDFQSDALVKTLLRSKPTYSFSADASYIIVGGLGGIGRSIALWLVSRGVRNLILLSRSGPSSKVAASLLAKLRSTGVRVEAPICDVTQFDLLARTIGQCTASGMPPVRGCIQGAMVLRDGLFNKLTFSDWAAATSPKTHASWNLHTLFPDLDFFILLSSISGTIGNPGQANYAAGNTYQDALAVHRTAQGQRAIALDLGWVASIGAVAESARLQQGVTSRSYLLPILENNLLALLDYFCSPTLPLQLGSAAHPVIGLAPPATAGDNLPSFFHTPPYRTIYHLGQSNGGTRNATKSIDDTAFFTECSSLADAGEHVAQGLARKLGAALRMPIGDVDTGKPLHAYGVDSLLAVELRNWFRKDVGAEVAIFDIMGEQSIAELAAVIAGKSRWRKVEWT
ncbi:MAG: hypothetical protein Q9166_007922 [cf. Caloplaca sp. 2 TL-2023]